MKRFHTKWLKHRQEWTSTNNDSQVILQCLTLSKKTTHSDKPYNKAFEVSTRHIEDINPLTWGITHSPHTICLCTSRNEWLFATKDQSADHWAIVDGHYWEYSFVRVLVRTEGSLCGWIHQTGTLLGPALGVNNASIWTNDSGWANAGALNWFSPILGPEVTFNKLSRVDWGRRCLCIRVLLR